MSLTEDQMLPSPPQNNSKDFTPVQGKPKGWKTVQTQEGGATLGLAAVPLMGAGARRVGWLPREPPPPARLETGPWGQETDSCDFHPFSFECY